MWCSSPVCWCSRIYIQMSNLSGLQLRISASYVATLDATLQKLMFKTPLCCDRRLQPSDTEDRPEGKKKAD